MKKLLLVLTICCTIGCSTDNASVIKPESQPTPEPEPAVKVFTGEIHLYTQAEVDAFAQEGYTHVTEYLGIGDGAGAVTSIASLSTLREVGVLNLLGTSLTTLTGLENLEKINGDIRLVKNYQLQNFDALSNLETFTGSLSIIQSDALTNFDGLRNAEKEIDDVYIDTNKSLTSLVGLTGVEVINGGLRIKQTSNIESFAGLENLTTIKNGLLIFRSNSLQDFTGLENLVTVYDITISQNAMIKSLEGMSLKHIENRLSVENNRILDDYCALANLETSAPYDWLIHGNPYNPDRETVLHGPCKL